MADYTSHVPVTGVAETAKCVRLLEAAGWLVGGIRTCRVDARIGEALEISSADEMMRELIGDFISRVKPTWRMLAPKGRAHVLNAVGRPVRQCLEEAGLAYGDGREIAEWWDRIALEVRNEADLRKVAVGRKGEYLSLIVEEARTGVPPRLQSLESNSDGFDILSVVDATCREPLRIEVKAARDGGEPRLFVTKNEWLRASDGRPYIFHIWRLSGDRASLAVITPEQMGRHMPRNNGNGAWEQVSLALSEFDDQFRAADGIAGEDDGGS